MVEKIILSVFLIELFENFSVNITMLLAIFVASQRVDILQTGLTAQLTHASPSRLSKPAIHHSNTFPARSLGLLLAHL